MRYLTTEEFDEKIPTGKHVIMFKASWCGPCKVMTPLLEQFESDYPDIEFTMVNIEEQTELTNRFYITSVPTILFYSGGEEKHKTKGAMGSVAFKKLIENYL